jgi:hypothetical protein
VCALDTPVCGDGRVCGAEVCEADTDCAPGETCERCRCENPSACPAGASARRVRLKLAATPFSVVLKGEAVIPEPWQGVDPAAHGVRFVVDATSGAGGFDVALPGGARWRVNAAGTRWDYGDPTGSQGGITKATVLDRSRTEPGLLRWTVRGKGGTIVLPDVTAVRTAAVLGTPAECAAVRWNGPGQPAPRCDGDAARFSCR